MSYIQSSPNPKWNSLNHNSKQLQKPLFLNPTRTWHTLLKNTIPVHTTLQVTLSRRVYNHTLQEIEVWNEYTW